MVWINAVGPQPHGSFHFAEDPIMTRSLSLAIAVIVVVLGVAPAQDGDPLPLKSEWKGKLTQRGKIKGEKEVPAEFDTVLVVTGRKGNEFDCELREKVADSSVTYICKGKISIGEKGGVNVEFESISAKSPNQDFVSVTKVPYTGTINGKTLKGSWKAPANKEDTEVSGEFTLERQ